MKYGIKMIYPSGAEEIEDDVFDTREEAEETAVYYCGCYKQGGEILNMSNPGDYPIDEDEPNCEYEIIEIA